MNTIAKRFYVSCMFLCFFVFVLGKQEAAPIENDAIKPTSAEVIIEKDTSNINARISDIFLLSSLLEDAYNAATVILCGNVEKSISDIEKHISSADLDLDNAENFLSILKTITSDTVKDSSKDQIKEIEIVLEEARKRVMTELNDLIVFGL